MNKLNVTLNSDFLDITKNFVTIFASGISIKSLTKEDFDLLKQNTFTISTNYPLSLHEPSFVPDAHIWSDHITSSYLNKYYSTRKKDCKLISRSEAFDKGQLSYNLVKMVDYWFDNVAYKFKVNFTLYSAINVIRRINKEIPILLFGLDGYIPDNSPCKDGIPFSKWYDFYITEDRINRTYKRNVKNLDRFVNVIEEDTKLGLMGNVYNCNLSSRVRYLTKKDYKSIIMSM